MCRKLAVHALSTCATLIKLAVSFPDRQMNALSMPLSHHSLNTLEAKRTHAKAGDSSFAGAVASLWNNL